PGWSGAGCSARPKAREGPCRPFAHAPQRPGCMNAGAEKRQPCSPRHFVADAWARARACRALASHSKVDNAPGRDDFSSEFSAHGRQDLSLARRLVGGSATEAALMASGFLLAQR